MKVGILSTVGCGFSWAGSEETWRLLATHILAEGHHVEVQASSTVASYEKLDLLRNSGADIWARPDLTPVTRRLATRKLYSRFRKFMSQPFDVVFLTMGGVADCIWQPDLLAAIEALDMPFVVNVQANAEGIVELESQREKLRGIYRKANAVIFQSHHNHQLAERQMAMRISDAHVISNPLREPMGDALDWPDGTARFAMVARMEVNDKQQDHLLEAFSDARWKNRDWNLCLYGTGPDAQHVRSLVNMYGLEERVEFIDYVANREDIWWDKQMHILPSRREGMPLALIESMACGRPAIVTLAGGNAEIVEDGCSGYVCPGMHPEVLCETLDRAWQDRNNWHAMGIAAQDSVRKNIHEDWGQRILDVVSGVLGEQ